MSSKRGKRLPPLRVQYEGVAKRIAKAGYGNQLPDTPKRVTHKSYEKLVQLESTVKEASKARKTAQQRVRYYKEKGYDVANVYIPKGLTKEEYQAYTAEYIKSQAYTAPNYRQNADGQENIQELAGKYSSTMHIIDRISEMLENFFPVSNRRNAEAWANRKVANHRIIEMYWFDEIDTEDMETKVTLAAKIEGKAEDLFLLVDGLLHGSDDPEQDSANLNRVIEIITGAGLSPLEQAAINDIVELGYEDFI